MGGPKKRWNDAVMDDLKQCDLNCSRLEGISQREGSMERGGEVGCLHPARTINWRRQRRGRKMRGRGGEREISLIAICM